MASNLIDKLKLDRPLVVFDTETTGLSTRTDRIIQLAYSKYFPDGRTEQACLLFNPGVPIPASASAVHGFTDEQVAHEPGFKDKAQELYEVFEGCMYSGFNIVSYDMPLLRQEFLRAGFGFEYKNEDCIDSKVIFHAMEERSLSAAYKYYCGKVHADAHDALADVVASAEVLSAQVDRYGLDQISEIRASQRADAVDSDGKFHWRDGQVCFSFSKFRYQPLSKIVETEPGFLQWMLNGDFSDEVKKIVRDALNGKLPTRD